MSESERMNSLRPSAPAAIADFAAGSARSLSLIRFACAIIAASTLTPANAELLPCCRVPRKSPAPRASKSYSASLNPSEHPHKNFIRSDGSPD